MHFITGGNFHGKKSWALIHYHFLLENMEGTIVSAFDVKDIQTPEKNGLFLIEGLEMWIRNRLNEESAEQTLLYFEEVFQTFLLWEKEESHRQVVLIGSDITKGVVPIEEQDRTWRDITGLIFQKAVQVSIRVDVVWYGLNERLR